MAGMTSYLSCVSQHRVSHKLTRVYFVLKRVEGVSEVEVRHRGIQVTRKWHSLCLLGYFYASEETYNNRQSLWFRDFRLVTSDTTDVMPLVPWLSSFTPPEHLLEGPDPWACEPHVSVRLTTPAQPERPFCRVNSGGWVPECHTRSLPLFLGLPEKQKGHVISMADCSGVNLCAHLR